MCVCVCVCAYHSQHRKEDDSGEASVSGVSARVDVWVSLLIELQHTQSSNHVHEGGVCRENNSNVPHPT